MALATNPVSIGTDLHPWPAQAKRLARFRLGFVKCRRTRLSLYSGGSIRCVAVGHSRIFHLETLSDHRASAAYALKGYIPDLGMAKEKERMKITASDEPGWFQLPKKR